MKAHYAKRKDRPVARQLRHTHSTAAALEDALAVAWDIIHEQARSLIYAEGRARRIIDILQLTRSGPQAYDPEQQSGKKIVIRSR